MPRTVSMSPRPNGVSTLSRRYFTYWSTTFEPPWYAKSQTASMIWVRESTVPGCRRNNSRSAISFGERESSVSPLHAALGRRVEPQVPDGQDRRSSTIVTAGQGADTGREFEEAEGLDQVVVSPHVQPTYTVADLVARGEHEDRSPDLGITQLPTELESVEPGQHDVEDDRPVWELLGHPQPVRTVVGHIDGVTLFLEAPLEQVRHPLVVFDHQDSHMSRLEGSPAVRRTAEPRSHSCEDSHLLLTIASSSEAHTRHRPTGQIEQRERTDMEKLPYETDPERSSRYAGDTGRRPPAPETIRNDGLRKIRRMSNWSLAALVVGIGATTGALAAATQSKTVGTAAVTTTIGTPTSAAGAVQGGPTLGSPVATTSASGVTVSAAAQQGGSPSPANSGRATPTGSGDS